MRPLASHLSLAAEKTGVHSTLTPLHVFVLLRNTIPPPPPLKVGLMHVSKYFSYAIDVNGVIK